MMPKPNKKKSLVKVLNSASGVITCLVIGPSRTEHLQERCEPLLVVDQLDLLIERVRADDLLRQCDQHRQSDERNRLSE